MVWIIIPIALSAFAFGWSICNFLVMMPQGRNKKETRTERLQAKISKAAMESVNAAEKYSAKLFECYEKHGGGIFLSERSFSIAERAELLMLLKSAAMKDCLLDELICELCCARGEE